ncbi:MAG: Mur ligase family protein, partial [Patescibacteria group bacterium]
GIPLTILGAPNAWNNPFRWLINIIDGLFLIVFSARYPKWLILEVGADRPGDIRSLSGWLRTQVVVVTRLPETPVHVEFFDSPEAVVEEKAALIKTLQPGGTLVLSGDDPHTRSLERRLPEIDGAKLLTFGFSKECDVRGEEVSALRDKEDAWPAGMTATIVAGDSRARLNIRGALGGHAFLPALGAAAVAIALGKSLEQTVGALAAYEPPAGRMHLLPGIKDTLIIDDTYNASPAATEAALEALALAGRAALDGGITLGRRIAVLGDMLELGRVSVAEHRKLGILCAKTCDLLITVGFRAHDIAQGALDGGMADANILQFEDSQAAGTELQNLLKAGDVVLVKGSQSVRTERVVKEVMAEPERANELLVRQDVEWNKR